MSAVKYYFSILGETSTGCIIGASGLGRRGTPMAQTGGKVANDLLNNIYSKACVDEYAQDQVGTPH